MVGTSLPDSSKFRGCGQPWSLLMSDVVSRIYPTLELTGMQKQSEAPLLHVRVERIVRLLATEEW